MSWSDFTRAVLSSLVGTIVSVGFGLYLRHYAKANRDELLRIIAGVDSVVAIKRRNRMDLAQYRKAIAAGAGVMLTGLLTYAESADLEPVLGPLVPEPVRPLVGVVLGGIATIASVILSTNAPKPGPVRTSAPSPTLDEPAPPDVDRMQPELAPEGTAPTAAAVAAPAGLDEATAAAVAEPPATGPWWQGVRPSEPGAATSLVELLPAPERKYQ